MRYPLIRRLSAALVGLGCGLGVSGAAGAGPPTLEIPIDCKVGQTCFVQNYVDRDPGPDYRDYTCGRLSADGHKGTDIRLRTEREMVAGVRVLAAAPGIVAAVRDAMPDVNMRKVKPSTLKGREAGNGVVVRHGDGWETQYSHMRRGSIAVKPGDRVAAGQVLGHVGLSGRTEFPHLHFGVRHRGRTVDPFVGLSAEPGCGVVAKALWSRAAVTGLAYVPSGLLGAGFAPGKPDIEAARRGDLGAARLPANAPGVVFWVDFFGALKDDEMRVRLVAPDGLVLARARHTFERSKAQYFQFVGKKRKADAWPVGVYRGEFALTRVSQGRRQTVIRATRTVEIK